MLARFPGCMVSPLVAGALVCMCNLPKGLKRVTVNNQKEIIAVPVDE